MDVAHLMGAAGNSFSSKESKLRLAQASSQMKTSDVAPAKKGELY
jgi:hypothetical protein